MIESPRSRIRSDVPSLEPTDRVGAECTSASTLGAARPGLLARALALGAQLALEVGAADDPLEAEADQTATEVTGVPKPALRSSGGQPGPSLSPAEETSLLARIASPSAGRALPAGLRGQMESAFGADFSRVRLHDGAQERADAAALGARAFTHNRDIWLGREASDGDHRLIAHELTHVVQQGGTGPTTPAASAGTRISCAPTSIQRQKVDPPPVVPPMSHDPEGYLAPPPDTTRTTSDWVMSTVLEAAIGGYEGIDITIRTEDTQINGGHTLVGQPGNWPGYVARSIVDDLRVYLKWSFERPGEYLLRLRRNSAGELIAKSWETVRSLPRRPAAGVPLTKEGGNVVVVIGSPKPHQGYPYQFVTAAKQVGGHAIWIVERSGYELANADLGKIVNLAPGGQVHWVTSSQELVAALNGMPRASVGLMKVFSHGVPGQVTLRYGWDDHPDYGIDKSVAHQIHGDVFSDQAAIDLESCNGGTNADGDPLAQAIADATGHLTFGWLGRTSYADVNRGTGGVKGSEVTFSRDVFAELWSRWRAETAPYQKAFTPRVQRSAEPGHGVFIQRELSDEAALEATRSLPPRVQSGNGGHPLGDDTQRREFLRSGREWFGTYDATIDHFGGITAANVPGNPLVAAETKPRLEAAVNEVNGQVPPLDVAFSFRSAFTTSTHLNSLSMHTLGYALDYEPTKLPRIGRDETAELIRSVTGSVANLQLGDYVSRRNLIERMGKDTETREATQLSPEATPESTSAAPSPAQDQLLARIASESRRLAATSAAFQDSLGAQKDAFLDLRTRYFQAAAKDRPEILAQVPAVIAPWLTALTTAEADITSAATAAGFTSASLPTAAAVRGELDRLHNVADHAGAAAAKGGEKPPTKQQINQMAQWARALGPTVVVVSESEPYAASAQRYADAASARITLLEPLWGAKERLALIARARAQLGNPVFLFGNPVTPKGGVPTTKAEVSAPSMAQIIERGFFSVGSTASGATAVSPDFLVALARHGFDIGASWSGEYTDSMHMELVVHKPTT
jgi:hypothetical protein